jgi:hypothetical protein
MLVRLTGGYSEFIQSRPKLEVDVVIILIGRGADRAPRLRDVDPRYVDLRIAVLFPEMHSDGSGSIDYTRRCCAVYD